MLIGAALLALPLLVNFIYGEDKWLSFVIPISGLLVVGFGLSKVPVKDDSVLAKEGIVLVALVWLLFSAVGATPFVISGYIPNYIDALFETASGFTTSGASICTAVEHFSHGILFWRSFTHFIGGMGVLVFVLAIIPKSKGAMHIYRAESPGPTSSKLVSKMSYTARILYAIYIGMTLIEIVLLLFGKMPLFDSITHAFSTAGTGGFSIKNTGVGYYKSAYIEIVISVFMFLFSINFNFYYLILIGNAKKAVKSEEVISYVIMIALSITAISINLVNSGIAVYENVGSAIKDAAFHVTAISSTTGMSNNVDFNLWPDFSKSILIFLMITGACAGSTGGGIKMARLILFAKISARDIKTLVRPRTVSTIRYEGEIVDEETINNTHSFLSLWFALVIITTIALCLDPCKYDLLSNFTATLTCISNVGPGLNKVGILSNFSGYSWASKLLLTFNMLAGRLELFPMIILFSPSTWKRK